jgi:hypothetical protein
MILEKGEKNSFINSIGKKIIFEKKQVQVILQQ